MTFHVDRRGTAHVYRGGCTPGMRFGCRRDCGHREFVEEYRLAAHAQAMRCEAATGFTPDEDRPEVRAFFRHPDTPTTAPSEVRLTFRVWLESHRRTDRGAAAPERQEQAA